LNLNHASERDSNAEGGPRGPVGRVEILRPEKEVHT